MNDWLTVATEAEVPSGGGITVRINGREFAVFSCHGQYHVLDGCCPHRGGPLGAGTIEEGGVHCPLHGWKFDLKSGAAIDHPGKSVRSWPVRLEDGRIQINPSSPGGGGQ